jgi:hypothetical protein
MDAPVPAATSAMVATIENMTNMPAGARHGRERAARFGWPDSGDPPPPWRGWRALASGSLPLPGRMLRRGTCGHLAVTTQ